MQVNQFAPAPNFKRHPTNKSYEFTNVVVKKRNLELQKKFPGIEYLNTNRDVIHTWSGVIRVWMRWMKVIIKFYIFENAFNVAWIENFRVKGQLLYMHFISAVRWNIYYFISKPPLKVQKGTQINVGPRHHFLSILVALQVVRVITIGVHSL